MNRRNENGSQTLELAMLLPVAVIVLLLVGDMARVVFYKIALQSAVREGARIASLHASRSEVEEVIRNTIGNITLEQLEIIRIRGERNPEQSQSAETPRLDATEVKAVAVVSLKMFNRLGLPQSLQQFRLEEHMRVPTME
jgi:Flp pilus assembly protein TadG